MSLDATRWAWMQIGLRPLHKLILLALADRAGADDCAFPSYEQLTADTGVDRKTIWAGFKELSRVGLISDSGDRRGNTGQITIWKLNGVEHRIHSKEFQKRNGSENGKESQKRNGSENGTVPKKDRNSSENGTGNSSENGTRNQSLEPTIGTDQEPSLRDDDTREENKRLAHTTTSGEGPHNGEPVQPVRSEAPCEDKRPDPTKAGGEGPDNGERAQHARSGRKRKLIGVDEWDGPSERCWALLDDRGIPRPFADSLLGEFGLYWAERGDKRPGWDATFINHVARNWERRQQHSPSPNAQIIDHASGQVIAAAPVVATAKLSKDEQRRQNNLTAAQLVLSGKVKSPFG